MNRGDAGEACVVGLLQQWGWRILERNYHSRFGEIDIIAAEGPYIVFVEVKTRAAGAQTGPLEAVTAGKRRKIIRTALCYLQTYETDLQPRFDVAAVIDGPGEPTVEYLENAYDGGGL